MVEAPVDAIPAVQSTLSFDSSGDVRGQVRLTGGAPLRDAIVVVGASAQQLGDLQPGAVAAIDLRANLANFPDQLSLGERGVIDHYRVLNNLFSYDRFALGGPTFQGEKGLPERDGVYLLGWADAVSIEVGLDGDRGRQQGETLYLIRLDAGS
jgi:hypothetical protein